MICLCIWTPVLRLASINSDQDSSPHEVCLTRNCICNQVYPMELLMMKVPANRTHANANVFHLRLFSVCFCTNMWRQSTHPKTASNHRPMITDASLPYLRQREAKSWDKRMNSLTTAAGEWRPRNGTTSTCNQLSTAEPTTAPNTSPPIVIMVALPTMIDRKSSNRIRITSIC